MVRVRRTAGGSSDTVQGFQLYEARQTFDGRFGGEDVPLTVALPEGAPTTHLLEQPPRYWELEVKGSGPDTICFTVPVYSRPEG